MDTFTVGLVLYGASMFGIGALVTWVLLRSREVRVGTKPITLSAEQRARLSAAVERRGEYPEITPQ